MPVQFEMVQGIHRETGRLADAHVGHLRFLHIGDDPQGIGYQRHQLGTGVDIGAQARPDLPQLPVPWRGHAGVVQVDAGQGHGGLGILDRSQQRRAVDDHRLAILPGNLQRSLGLRKARRRRRLAGAGDIQFTS